MCVRAGACVHVRACVRACGWVRACACVRVRPSPSSASHSRSRSARTSGSPTPTPYFAAVNASLAQTNSPACAVPLAQSRLRSPACAVPLATMLTPCFAAIASTRVREHSQPLVIAARHMAARGTPAAPSRAAQAHTCHRQYIRRNGPHCRSCTTSARRAAARAARCRAAARSGPAAVAGWSSEESRASSVASSPAARPACRRGQSGVQRALRCARREAHPQSCIGHSRPRSARARARSDRACVHARTHARNEAVVRAPTRAHVGACPRAEALAGRARKHATVARTRACTHTTTGCYTQGRVLGAEYTRREHGRWEAYLQRVLPIRRRGGCEGGAGRRLRSDERPRGLRGRRRCACAAMRADSLRTSRRLA